MSNVVYILRSLPGAGKSTLADIIACGAMYNNQSYTICCADDYHIIDGVYTWKPENVASSHKKCREKFKNALDSHVHTIVISNTNTRHSEYAYYYEEAKKANYFVQVIIVGEFTDEAVERYVTQNTHNVPRETIIKMRDRFQL